MHPITCYMEAVSSIYNWSENFIHLVRKVKQKMTEIDAAISDIKLSTLRSTQSQKFSRLRTGLRLA